MMPPVRGGGIMRRNDYYVKIIPACRTHAVDRPGKGIYSHSVNMPG